MYPEGLSNENEVKKGILKNIITKDFTTSELPDEVFLLSGGITKTQSGEDYKLLSYSNEDVYSLMKLPGNRCG